MRSAIRITGGSANTRGGLSGGVQVARGGIPSNSGYHWPRRARGKKADGESRVHDNGTTPCEKRLWCCSTSRPCHLVVTFVNTTVYFGDGQRHASDGHIIPLTPCYLPLRERRHGIDEKNKLSDRYRYRLLRAVFRPRKIGCLDIYRDLKHNARRKLNNADFFLKIQLLTKYK